MGRGRTWCRSEGGADPGLLDEPPDAGGASRDIGLLQRQYYDSMTANGITCLQTLQAFAGHTHILLGTDGPAPSGRGGTAR